jgi:hypothetical protein
MSDPVRDTRQAVDAARRAVREYKKHMLGEGAQYVAGFRGAIDALEAAVRADERRETFARGDDATEARP